MTENVTNEVQVATAPVVDANTIVVPATEVLLPAVQTAEQAAASALIMVEKRDEAMPAHIGKSLKGTEGLSAEVRPPRIIIVNKLSTNLKDTHKFEDGDIILLPMCIKLGSMTSPITITPIFWYKEYVAINPRKATMLAKIRDRSIDIGSDIAHKAKERFKCPCPELPTEQIEYAEVLNFIVYCYEARIEAVVSFMKGEYQSGSNLAALITMRGVESYAGVYKLKSAVHKNRANDEWHGFDAANNDSPKWTGEELFARFEKTFDKLEESLKAGLIKTDYDDEATPAPGTAAPAASSKF